MKLERFAILIAQAQASIMRQAIYFIACVAIFAAVACSLAATETQLARQAVIDQENISYDNVR